MAAIVEHTGEAVPRDVAFTDAAGRSVAFGDLLGDRPVLLGLAYYDCPMLCPMIQRGEAEALSGTGLRPGRDYRAVTVSIDPADTPAVSREWQTRAIRSIAGATPDDWRFLTGREDAIARLAASVGFEYARDPETGQYSHAAALFVLTPDGRVARYLYGITFEPADVRAALEAAAAGRIGGTLDRLLLRCFHYVPSLRRHAGLVRWTLRLGGLGVVLAVAWPLALLWRREARRAG